MTVSKAAWIGAGLMAAALATAPGAATAAEPLTVVELFTSQGCSSCPPANANLIELSKRDDVLALSFAVTYWDRLGWTDTFGQEIFTDRQRIYEPALGERGPFTPQIVVNGKASAVGSRRGEMEQVVASTAPIAGPDIALDGGTLSIGAGDVPATATDIWLIRYDPGTVEVPVGRGENTGRTLAQTHVVHALERIGSWDGTAAHFPVAAAPAGLKTAVLVQLAAGGAILAAVTD